MQRREIIVCICFIFLLCPALATVHLCNSGNCSNCSCTASTIEINATFTAPSEDQASVVNIGSTTAAIFDFRIPKGLDGLMNQTPNMTAGSQGIQGVNGTPGVQGEKGDTGNTGETGPANMTAGPQGIQGIQGIEGQMNQTRNMTAGPTGSAATISINSTFTLPNTSAATVTNIGTSSAAIFDFGIPQGVWGANSVGGGSGDDSWNITYPLLSGMRLYTGKMNLAMNNVSNITTETGGDAVNKTYMLSQINSSPSSGSPPSSSFDTYTLSVQSLTRSPADSVSNYYGNRPVAASTTANINKVYIPASGTITSATIYTYSGTAGTAEAWSYYIRKNNAVDFLIQSQAVATNERIFSNASINVPVSVGDYIEIRSVNPLWATNPLTTIDGGWVLINTTAPSSTTAGYSLGVQALTSSPVDGATVYFGNLPKAPVTTAAISKVYIPTTGTIKRAEIYCYSGTAGTAQSWSLYVRKNNAADYLVTTLTQGITERMFRNASINIPVTAGDYVEIKGVQPTWATNPATTIYGGYLYVE